MLVLLTSLPIACGSDRQDQPATVPPASTLPSGWKLYKPAGYGFEIATPDQWVALDAQGVLGSADAKSYIAHNPYMRQQVERVQRKARLGGVPLTLFDLSAQGQAISDATGGYAPGLQLEVQRLLVATGIKHCLLFCTIKPSMIR